GHLFAVSSAAASSTTPTDLNVTGTQPAYSPDGTKVAFVDAGWLHTRAAQVSGAMASGPNTSGATQPDWQALPPVINPGPGTGPPVQTSYPTINLSSGDSSPVVGHFLTASVGTWTGAFPITFTYQWKRCD